ncbi:OLC1v1038768C1 [Oldenlandia corymbosa var. corymbosa]|uniref:OLC1v1038768C1 n=1 Tax=Oldenlandia corymbosa var. corymbosa TaxID=529605 RepID=A0AAV1D1I8_OLDCO|nr:OLC1v1038768C1 [Oldenlandia corymbosa var. corymbosa]
MKLRIRSTETRETLRIEVPDQCSLQQLKERLSQTLSGSSSSGPIPPDSIRLSLNKVDEIQSSSPAQDILQSLGIASGDLIYYTVISSEALIPNSQVSSSIVSLNSEVRLNLGQENRPMESDRSANKKEHVLIEPQKPDNAEPNLPLQADDQLQSMNIDDAKSGEELAENMEIEGEDGDGSDVEIGRKSFSVPGFLRKVFTEELGHDEDSGGGKHKLLVTAVHAVLLESGFIGFDMDSKTVVEGFQFRNVRPGYVYMGYTLPEINEKISSDLECQNYAFELKFSSVGKFMNVYGCLLGPGSVKHSVCLNEDKLVSIFNVVWANCDLKDDILTAEGGILGTSPEKEVFQFWRTVKDNLALPLLIELYEKFGFGLPPCFMRLHTDLQVKILGLLPGVDMAKISCVSKELRYLASSDDLWKQKCVEQFGDEIKSDERGHWKEKFARLWEGRKRRRLAYNRSVCLHRFRNPQPPLPWFPRRIPDPQPPFPWFPRSRRGGRPVIFEHNDSSPATHTLSFY